MPRFAPYPGEEPKKAKTRIRKENARMDPASLRRVLGKLKAKKK